MSLFLNVDSIKKLNLQNFYQQKKNNFNLKQI